MSRHLLPWRLYHDVTDVSIKWAEKYYPWCKCWPKVSQQNWPYMRLPRTKHIIITNKLQKIYIQMKKWGWGWSPFSPSLTFSSVYIYFFWRLLVMMMCLAPGNIKINHFAMDAKTLYWLSFTDQETSALYSNYYSNLFLIVLYLLHGKNWLKHS